jgi:hypothetical protein
MRLTGGASSGLASGSKTTLEDLAVDEFLLTDTMTPFKGQSSPCRTNGGRRLILLMRRQNAPPVEP